ncbi:unnamed protein product [Rhizophagus irregularis]|nr:unnamed protein product [Rhizophagus irregularis]
MKKKIQFQLLCLKLLAKSGINSAQYKLGQRYESEDGIKTKVFKWYQLAAKNGNNDAQYNLGLCYENGIGTKSSKK